MVSGIEALHGGHAARVSASKTASPRIAYLIGRRIDEYPESRHESRWGVLPLACCSLGDFHADILHAYPRLDTNVGS